VRFPPKVEGQVVKVNVEEGKVTVRTSDGTVHEFQASKETLQELKVGDRIAAKLRNAPNC
jgi:aconitase B